MRLTGKLKRFASKLCKKYIEDKYKKSGFHFVYKTPFGVDTYVHHEKLFDMIETNSSCDAEPLLASLSEVIQPLDVAIDVGANIGIVSCWLAKNSKHVYSFEPERSNLSFLKSNLALNNVNNVTIVDAAVGKEAGFVDFYIRDAFGHHGVQQKHITAVNRIKKVKIIALDDFCSEKSIEHISLLKIDVEGGEFDVLQGFLKHLQSKNVGLIVFEHAPVLLGEGQKLAVYDLLVDCGYTVFDLQHNPLDRKVMGNLPQGDFYAKVI